MKNHGVKLFLLVGLFQVFAWQNAKSGVVILTNGCEEPIDLTLESVNKSPIKTAELLPNKNFIYTGTVLQQDHIKVTPIFRHGLSLSSPRSHIINFYYDRHYEIVITKLTMTDINYKEIESNEGQVTLVQQCLTVTESEHDQKENRKPLQNLAVNRKIYTNEETEEKTKVSRIWVHIGNNKGKKIRFDEKSNEVLYTADLDTCTALIFVGDNSCYMIHSDQVNATGQGKVCLEDGINLLIKDKEASYNIGLIGGSANSQDVKLAVIKKLLPNIHKILLSNAGSASVCGNGTICETT